MPCAQRDETWSGEATRECISCAQPLRICGGKASEDPWRLAQERLDLAQVQLDPTVQPMVCIDVVMVKEHPEDMKASVAFRPSRSYGSGKPADTECRAAFTAPWPQEYVMRVADGRRRLRCPRGCPLGGPRYERNTQLAPGRRRQRRVVILARKHPKDWPARRGPPPTRSAVRKEWESSGEIRQIGERTVARGESTRATDIWAWGRRPDEGRWQRKVTWQVRMHGHRHRPSIRRLPRATRADGLVDQTTKMACQMPGTGHRPRRVRRETRRADIPQASGTNPVYASYRSLGRTRDRRCAWGGA
jgi:hypothetical protein